jgi:hypothetical protein
MTISRRSQRPRQKSNCNTGGKHEDDSTVITGTGGREETVLPIFSVAMDMGKALAGRDSGSPRSGKFTGKYLNFSPLLDIGPLKSAHFQCLVAKFPDR